MSIADLRGKRVHAGQPDTPGHVLEPSGSRSTGARQLAPRGPRYIVFQCSGPSRRGTLVALQERRGAGSATDRPYVIWRRRAVAANIYVYCPPVGDGLDRSDLEEELESFFGDAADD